MDKTEAKNIDEYIKQFPDEIQERMNKLRKLIIDVAPNALEEIRYQMASFKVGEKSYVYFAGFKNHISFYPFPSGNEKFEKRAEKYETSGRGTIQFQNDEEIDYDLVKDIVEFYASNETGAALYPSEDRPV